LTLKKAIFRLENSFYFLFLRWYVYLLQKYNKNDTE